MPITTDTRAFGSGKFALELDGKDAGWLASAEGGYATADIFEEKLGPDHVVRKHIGAPKYEDLTIECGAGMSGAFYDWIRSTLAGTWARKDGALVAVDYNLKQQSRLTFTQALIREVAFPALDAASKDAARLTVKIAPELTRYQRPSADGAKAAVDVKQKKWSQANFRLKLDGLSFPGVSKIAPIVVTTAIVENAVGELREYQKEPAHAEYSDLVVTLAERDAQGFVDWHEDFVIKGNNGPDREKSGTLELLGPDLKEVLFTLSFSGLGIYRLAPEKVEAGTDAIRRLTASMYCEQMSLTVGAAAPAPAQPPPTSEQQPAASSGGMILSGEYPDRFTRLRQIV